MAAAVYARLARVVESTAQHLALDLGVAPDTVERPLAELQEAGLIQRSAGRVQVSVDTPAAMRGLLDAPGDPVATAILEARQALDHVLESVAERLPAGRAEYLTRPQELAERVRSIVIEARQEVVNLHAGPTPAEETLEHTIEDDRAVLRRGIAVRTVCPADYARHEHIRRHVADLEGHGAQTRFADAVPHRLIVADRRTAIVPMDPYHAQRGAIVVTEPGVVRCLFHLAAAIFRSGRPMETLTGLDEEPSELDRTVLLLMSAGLTDAVSARRLSVTERQYRRYVAKVMARLGATSRFQAGVRAVERGWL